MLTTILADVLNFESTLGVLGRRSKNTRFFFQTLIPHVSRVPTHPVRACLKLHFCVPFTQALWQSNKVHVDGCVERTVS